MPLLMQPKMYAPGFGPLRSDAGEALVRHPQSKGTGEAELHAVLPAVVDVDRAPPANSGVGDRRRQPPDCRASVEHGRTEFLRAVSTRNTEERVGGLIIRESVSGRNGDGESALKVMGCRERDDPGPVGEIASAGLLQRPIYQKRNRTGRIKDSDDASAGRPDRPRLLGDVDVSEILRRGSEQECAMRAAIEDGFELAPECFLIRSAAIPSPERSGRRADLYIFADPLRTRPAAGDRIVELRLLVLAPVNGNASPPPQTIVQTRRKLGRRVAHESNAAVHFRVSAEFERQTEDDCVLGRRAQIDIGVRRQRQAELVRPALLAPNPIEEAARVCLDRWRQVSRQGPLELQLGVGIVLCEIEGAAEFEPQSCRSRITDQSQAKPPNRLAVIPLLHSNQAKNEPGFGVTRARRELAL